MMDEGDSLLSILQYASHEPHVITHEKGKAHKADVSDLLAEQDASFFKALIKARTRIKLTYRAEKRRAEKAPIQSNKRFDALISALILAEILSHIYQHYLFNGYQLKCLQDEIKALQKEASLQGGILFRTRANATIPFEESVKKGINSLLWPRIVVIRLRRLLKATIPFVGQFEKYKDAIACFDEIAGTTLKWSGWVFHGTRLLINTVLILKSVIPGFWMTTAEDAVGWFLRLEVHFQQHWVEIAFDVLWIMGMVMPGSMYLTCALSMLEIMIACLQTFMALNALNHFSIEEQDTNQQYVEEQSSYEYKKLLLRLINIISVNGLNLLNAVLSSPNNTLISFVIACLLFGITVLSHVLNKWLLSPHSSDEKVSIDTPSESVFSTDITFFSYKKESSPYTDKYDQASTSGGIHVAS